MKTSKHLLSAVLLMLVSSLSFAGSLEGTVIKHATAPLDIDGNGIKYYLVIDIDDSVATECAVPYVGNDVAILELNSATSQFNNIVYTSMLSAQNAATSVKIDYTVADTDAQFGVDLCVLDTFISMP